MKFKDIIEDLFGFSAPTWYRWKKENRKIVDLIERYLSEQDLEEFIAYGTIEKLEFANLQDYGNRVAKFGILLTKLKDFLYVDYINRSGYFLGEDDIESLYENREELTKIENEGLSYLALTFAKIKNENSEDFTVDNLSKLILYSYDAFQEEIKKKNSINWLNSILLGKFLDIFRKEYPAYSDYNHILCNMYKNDFISFVKLCSKHQPDYLDIAIRFCIQFNQYKYMQKSNTDELYNHIINVSGSVTYNSFNYEKFKSEIQKIKNHENN